MKRAALLSLLLLGLACGDAPEDASPSPATADPSTGIVTMTEAGREAAGITTAAVREVTRADALEALGVVSLDERRTARLGAIVDGVVAEVLVQPGDRVEEGAVLALILSHQIHDVWADYFTAAARLQHAAAGLSYAQTAAGRAERPRLAVVTAGLDLDLSLPLFADRRPGEDAAVILTGSAAAPEAVERLGAVAEVAHLPSPRPQPAQILAELDRRGAGVVLSEGGPSFNGQLADAGVIDELCLSVAPLVAGGASTRIVHGSTRSVPQRMRVDHLLEASDTLFIRYVGEPAHPAAAG